LAIPNVTTTATTITHSKLNKSDNDTASLGSRKSSIFSLVNSESLIPLSPSTSLTSKNDESTITTTTTTATINKTEDIINEAVVSTPKLIKVTRKSSKRHRISTNSITNLDSNNDNDDLNMSHSFS
jgi:hypothetical protein